MVNNTKSAKDLYVGIPIILERAKRYYECYPFHNVARVDDMLKIYSRYFIGVLSGNNNNINEGQIMTLAIAYYHANADKGENYIEQAINTLIADDYSLNEDMLNMIKRLMYSQKYLISGIPEKEFEGYSDQYKNLVSIYHDVLNSYLIGSEENIRLNFAAMWEECCMRGMDDYTSFVATYKTLETICNRKNLFYTRIFSHLGPLNIASIVKTRAFYKQIIVNLDERMKPA